MLSFLGILGSGGFKGTRKSTPYASQVAADGAARRAARSTASRTSRSTSAVLDRSRVGDSGAPGAGLQIHAIVDVTPIPHNGCRPKAPPRLRTPIPAPGLQQSVAGCYNREFPEPASTLCARRLFF